MSKRYPNFESAELARDHMREAVPDLRWSVVENRDGSFSVINSRTYSGGKYDLSPTERKYQAAQSR